MTSLRVTARKYRSQRRLKCRSQSCEKRMTTMMKKSEDLADLSAARARKKTETFEKGHVRALRDGDRGPPDRPRNSYRSGHVSVTYSRRAHADDGTEKYTKYHPQVVYYGYYRGSLSLRNGGLLSNRDVLRIRARALSLSLAYNIHNLYIFKSLVSATVLFFLSSLSLQRYSKSYSW